MIQRAVEKLIVGTALAVAATALLPIAKTTLRPLVTSGMQGGVQMLNRARSLAQIAREEVEDIFAEAQFERIKKQLDDEIAAIRLKN
jgi:hypothetical protein